MPSIYSHQTHKLDDNFIENKNAHRYVLLPLIYKWLSVATNRLSQFHTWDDVLTYNHLQLVNENHTSYYDNVPIASSN